MHRAYGVRWVRLSCGGRHNGRPASAGVPAEERSFADGFLLWFPLVPMVIGSRGARGKTASDQPHFEQPTGVTVGAGTVRLHPAVVGAGGLAAPLGLPLHQRLHVGWPGLRLRCPSSGVARHYFACHILLRPWRKVAHPVGAGVAVFRCQREEVSGRNSKVLCPDTYDHARG